jgi:hypothetical protein
MVDPNGGGIAFPPQPVKPMASDPGYACAASECASPPPSEVIVVFVYPTPVSIRGSKILGVNANVVMIPWEIPVAW